MRYCLGDVLLRRGSSSAPTKVRLPMLYLIPLVAVTSLHLWGLNSEGKNSHVGALTFYCSITSFLETSLYLGYISSRNT